MPNETELVPDFHHCLKFNCSNCGQWITAIQPCKHFDKYLDLMSVAEKMREALKKIQNIDYRGNAHASHYIAKEALTAFEAFKNKDSK